MSLTTYVLLSALHHGLNETFHASILGEVASKAVAVIVLDFLVVKASLLISSLLPRSLIGITRLAVSF
jgi:hypothetical protein